MSDRLLFFPSPVDMPQTERGPDTTVIRVHSEVTEITEQVTVRAMVPAPTAHLAVADEQWTWRELRDYVVGQIESATGLFPRDEMKEQGIFKAFCTRWGVQAPAIARYAFDTMGGYWKGAPVKVTRFCKASDEYFAQPIVETLTRNK